MDKKLLALTKKSLSLCISTPMLLFALPPTEDWLLDSMPHSLANPSSKASAHIYQAGTRQASTKQASTQQQIEILDNN
jgi:hypothetical protein